MDEFKDRVKVLLVHLCRNADFADVRAEGSRQFLEGYLGVDRNFFKQFDDPISILEKVQNSSKWLKLN